MGVLPSANKTPTTSTSAKRTSAQLDFSNLGPLKTGGTVGFSTFRDRDTESARRRKARKKTNTGSPEAAMDEDSDDDDDSEGVVGKMEDIDDKNVKMDLGPDDSRLAAGVDRIRVREVQNFALFVQ
jgi:hypothetical protein